MAKIGILATNLAGSGAEKVVLNLARMFSKEGDEVHVFLLEDIISYDTEGVTLHTLSSNRGFYKALKGVGDKILAARLKKKINALEKNSQKFDMFLSNLPAADRVAVAADLPQMYYIIHTSYSMELEEFRKRKQYGRAKRKEELYRRLYKGKDLIAVSQGIKEDLDVMSIGYRSCQVIYNPFDFDMIRKMAEEKSDLKIEEEYILSASAFRPVKRYDILLEAYSKLDNPPPLKLLCNSHPELVKMIQNFGLEKQVEILGFTSNPYPVIKNAKLLVLSSEREGLPTVLIEALILHTPVVSTNCKSGPSEILTGELASYLAKINDPDDLKKTIEKALFKYSKITNASIEKFNEKTIFTQYRKLIASEGKY